MNIGRKPAERTVRLHKRLHDKSPHTVRAVTTGTNEYQMPLVIAFADYNKAFDRTNVSSVIQAPFFFVSPQIMKHDS